MNPNPLRQLGPDQCLELLASCQVGRVGTSVGALPVILPVNYVVFDHGVLSARHPAPSVVVAFEADAYDPDGSAGWSVLLVGKANEISHPVEFERAEAFVSNSEAQRGAVAAPAMGPNRPSPPSSSMPPH